MKRAIALLLFVVFVAGLVFVADDAFAWRRKNDKGEEAKVEETVAAVPAAKEGKLVGTFDNDEEMAEFEQLYVSKQATFGRMGVLQAYFAMEQNNLTEIDKQMERKFGFKMDPNKMYDLNRDDKEIRELEPITPPAE